MRIYFNLNTVAGKATENPSCTAFIGFIQNCVLSGDCWIRAAGEGQMLCLTSASSAFVLSCSDVFRSFRSAFRIRKPRSNADSDNSVTVKVVPKHFR